MVQWGELMAVTLLDSPVFRSQERSSERIVSTQCAVQRGCVCTGLRHGPWNVFFHSFVFFPPLRRLFVLPASRSLALIPL